MKKAMILLTLTLSGCGTYGAFLPFVKDDLPKITIAYNWHISSVSGREDDTTLQKGAALAEELQARWDRRGDRILRAMTDILGVPFKEPEIMVYLYKVVEGVKTIGASDPMMIAARQYDEASLCGMMTHELSHRLLMAPDIPIGKKWWKMFPDEYPVTRNHIFVYALMQEVFDKLNMPECIESEKNKIEGSPFYARALAIVDERGSKELIAIFRSWLTETPSHE